MTDPQHPLPTSDLEQAMERLAAALDEVGPAREREFLSALALALTARLDGLAELEAALAEARRSLVDAGE